MLIATLPSEGEKILSIKSTTYFGECVGYCDTEIDIAVTGITYTEHSTEKQQSDRTAKRPLTKSDWNKISDQVSNSFFLLPPRIGDPDGVDQGGETLEITTESRSKKIEFEYRADIPAARNLLKTIRALRLEMSKEAKN